MPQKTIVLITLGLMSFAASLSIDVIGEKGAYKYDFIWTVNFLTIEWGGSLWSSR